MPSGKVHARFSEPAAHALTVVGVAGAVFVYPGAVGVAVGAWVAHFCTPDIDHHVVTHEERRMYRVHPLVGFLWQLYWTPYQRTHPHRGESHRWTGTIERFVYLLWLPILLSLWALGADALPFWCMVLIGQTLVDMVHIALDRIASARKVRQ